MKRLRVLLALLFYVSILPALPGWAATPPVVGTLVVKAAPWRDITAYGGGTSKAAAANATALSLAWDNAVAAGGGTIVIPIGVFSINAVAKTSGSNIHIVGMGPGSVLSINDVATGLSFTGVDNVIFSNLTVGGTSRVGVYFANSARSGMRHCGITGATKTGSGPMAGVEFLAPTTDMVFEHNRLWGNGDGLENSSFDFTAYPNGAVYTHERLRVRYNKISGSLTHFNITNFNCQDSDATMNDVDQGNHGEGTASGYPIAFYGSGGQAGYRNKALNNNVRNAHGSGIYFALQSQYSIEGNTVKKTGQGMTNVTEPVGGISVNSTTLLSTLGLYDSGAIRGNNVYDSGLAGITVSDANYVDISGNVVDNAATRGDAAAVYFSGIFVRASVSSSHVKVTSNIVRRVVNDNATPGGSGILSFSGAGDNTISYLDVSHNTVDNTVNGLDLQNAWKSRATHNDVLNATTTPIYTVAGAFNERFGNTMRGGAISGTATLVNGTVTVSTTEVEAGSQILLSRATLAGTPGHIYRGTITDNTSFVINSSSATDNSAITWVVKQ